MTLINNLIKLYPSKLSLKTINLIVSRQVCYCEQATKGTPERI